MAQFTLRQLEYLSAVAEHGSIAAAALALHISESAVATALTQLEKAVDATLLLRRRAHGVALTIEGERAVRLARNLLASADDLVAELSPGALTGTVRLGCYPTLAPSEMPRLVRELELTHPGLRVEISTALSEGLQDGVRNGHLDLAIGYGNQLADDLSHEKLYDLPPYMAIHPEHRLANESSIQLRDLAAEPFIRYDRSPSWENTQAILDEAGVTVETRFKTDDFELARSFVGAGLGWSLFVVRSRTNTTRDGATVITKEIAPAPQSAEVVAYWNSSRPRTRVEPFLTALRELHPAEPD
ncbi:LysR family transcriptional regulator [Gulosibacter molinativorax]|uniref:LysR family transcriptional regulator n=1 Tax=Gulosibacter molinativorax TaxID=256821 RepID=A0ABT7CB11_9MICO|nr:LysR family transcriptional regulator [Gulosibacter molinativorax]MDJ1371999.1 LysR family transcriptional regulator [Gulosibacter molinativorax]QUY62635.1 LysR family transcriptional regulator [Gulosibacter molinativorax]